MITISIQKPTKLDTHTFKDAFEAGWALLHANKKKVVAKTGDVVLDAYLSGDTIDGQKYLDALLQDKSPKTTKLKHG